MAAATTPVKTPRHSRSQSSETFKNSENSDPNLPAKSPVTKSEKKGKNAAVKTPRRNPPSPPKERKFIVAKKKNRYSKKCREAAYEALRASQDDFFKKDPVRHELDDELKEIRAGEEFIKKEPERSELDQLDGSSESKDLEGSSKVRKMRSLMMEQAMVCIPDSGSGRVKHLVKAFENMLSISKDREGEKDEESQKKVMNWPLPGLQPLMKNTGNEEPSVSVFSSAEFLPTRDFARDSRLCSSLDSNDERLSLGSRTSGGSRRSRRNSTDSTGRNWSKKLKVTSQHPFKLRTEQRGRLKEEHFLKKVKEMIMEEEKKRIPIAQGLPWTTDEPECLVKPPVKDLTEPIDVVLHSDVRAVERAEFDHYVAERLNFAEQLKSEREKQQKLSEEEEVKRLRKELVPRAQPMPFFDRPFVPKKSSRPRTIPKEPRFHVRPALKTCVSMMGR